MTFRDRKLAGDAPPTVASALWEECPCQAWRQTKWLPIAQKRSLAIQIESSASGLGTRGRGSMVGALLDLAESELEVLSVQCLDRRVPD